METFTQTPALRRSTNLYAVFLFLPCVSMPSTSFWKPLPWTPPLIGRIVATVLWLAFALFAVLEQRRRRVRAERGGLTSRTLWRTRRIPWQSILSIEPRQTFVGTRYLQAITTDGKITLATPFVANASFRAGAAEFDAKASRLEQLVSAHR